MFSQKGAKFVFSSLLRFLIKEKMVDEFNEIQLVILFLHCVYFYRYDTGVMKYRILPHVNGYYIEVRSTLFKTTCIKYILTLMFPFKRFFFFRYKLHFILF